uniref:Uncharacterized protein n=1 Tax=Arundo donax TaxID=35708 RepID=A0A0A9BBA4_ARUDO
MATWHGVVARCAVGRRCSAAAGANQMAARQRRRTGWRRGLTGAAGLAPSSHALAIKFGAQDNLFVASALVLCDADLSNLSSAWKLFDGMHERDVHVFCVRAGSRVGKRRCGSSRERSRLGCRCTRLSWSACCLRAGNSGDAATGGACTGATSGGY